MCFCFEILFQKSNFAKNKNGITFVNCKQEICFFVWVNIKIKDLPLRNFKKKEEVS